MSVASSQGAKPNAPGTHEARRTGHYAPAHNAPSTTHRAPSTKHQIVDIIHYPDDPRPASWHQPVLALGNFDGLHRGHMKILERVRRRAEERSGVAVPLTFEPHPT